MNKIFKNPIFFFLVVTIVFFYKTFFFFQVPFPGDLLISEYSPWKFESYLGYNPGSYPNKAQYFDVIRQLYPWKILAMDLWKEGAIPLWNPYNFSGTPLLANNQTGAFYLFNILFFIFPNITAWSFYIVLQPFLASLFTYIFLRSIGRSKRAGAIFGISFGFSLFMSTFLEYGNIGHTILWLPLLLFSVQKVSNKGRLQYYLLPALLIPVILFAGHLQIAAAVLAFSFLYGLWVVGLKNRIRHVSILLIIFGIGIGISAVQLLPTLELVKNSARVAHSQKEVNELLLLQPQQALLLFAPDAYGNPATKNYLLKDAYPGNALYVGIIPLLFAGIASLLVKKKDWIFRFFLLFASLLVAFFVRNPLSEYLFNLPLFAASSPSNFFFLFSFCITVIASYGFDLKPKLRVRSLLPLLTIFIFFVLLFVINYFFFQINSKQVIVAVIIFFVSAIGVLIFLSQKHKLTWVILAAILVVDLFYYFQKFNPFVPASLVYPASPIEKFLKSSDRYYRFLGVGGGRIEANFQTQMRLYSPDGYDPLYPKKYADFIPGSTRSDVTIGIIDPNILNILGVKYVLDRVENGSTEKTFPSIYKPIKKIEGWTVFENTLVFPRAFLITGLFEEAYIKSYDASRIIVEKPTEKPGRLVVSSILYPGWNAYVDGKRRQTKDYLGTFLAVDTNKGDKVVTFSYEPDSFSRGLSVSIISIVALLLLGFYLRKRII